MIESFIVFWEYPPFRSQTDESSLWKETHYVTFFLSFIEWALVVCVTFKLLKYDIEKKKSQLLIIAPWENMWFHH